jgi:hypothetical protein
LKNYLFYEKVTQREKVVNMPVVNKTRHLEQELTGGHKMPEDQMKKVHTLSYCMINPAIVLDAVLGFIILCSIAEPDPGWVEKQDPDPG